MPTYTVGTGKTYSTITAALAAIPSNITGTGAHQVVVDAGTYNEGSTLTLPRPTGSDANNYVEIMAASGSEHKGNPAAGVIIRCTTGSFIAAVRVRPSSRLTNLVISVSSGSNQTPGIGHVSGEFSPNNIPTICKNIIVLQSSVASAYGIDNLSPVYCYNCIAINVALNNVTGFSPQGDTFIKHKLYNCGAYNFKDGFTDNGKTEVKNCWSWKFSGSTGFDFTGFLSTSASNNASSDATAPGASSLTNRTGAQFGFASVSTNNFHLVSTSTLKNVGTNLSSFFTTDIDLETIVTYSIGPDAYSIVHTYLLGPTRLYTTLLAVSGAIPSDLTGTGVHEIIADASTYAAIFNNSITGKSGTSATDYIHLHAATGSEHLGNVNSGVIFTISNDVGTAFTFPPWTRLTNLIFKTAPTGTSQGLSATGNSTFINIIVMAGTGYGLSISSAGAGNTYINCISTKLDINSASTFKRGFGLTNGDKAYNCGSFYHSIAGFLGANATSIPCINCWAINAPGSSGDCWNGAGGNFIGSSNNASSDSTAPGANNLLSLTLTQAAFTDYLNSNFHISVLSRLNAAGVDSSSIFTTDIDGEIITNWPIGPDCPGSPVIVPTTSSSPAKKDENRNKRIKDALAPGLRLQYSKANASSNRARNEKDAVAPNIVTKAGDPSDGFNHKQSQNEASDPNAYNARRGLPNSYISVTPNLGAYASAVLDGKGMRLYADKENLQVGAQYRELDLVGNSRAINNRAHLPNLPQGQFTFTPRSNDILAPLMSHFQVRLGSALAGGTTYYEFVPSLRSPSLFGSGFGTGTYGTSGDMFSVNITKLVNGSAIRFNQGVCDALVWEFKADNDFSLTSEYRFKSASLIGSSSAGSTGSYSTLPSFSGFNTSIDFMGVAPVDFKMTLKNKVSDYNPAGGTYSYFRFTDYFVEGNATIDLSKVSLAYLGSMLGTQGFSISGTLSNSLADRIIFQLPNCRMDNFDIKLGENTISVPFKAYEPDSFSAPVKVMVWTQHYSATTFEPN